MVTAKEILTAHWVREGLAHADLDAALAHGQRRYEEGRDGTRQRQSRFWDGVLAEMKSGVQPPLDADGMEKLLRLAERA